MENKRVELNLGFLCNNKCRFCLTNVAQSERKFIPLSVLKKELKTYYRKGYRQAGFLGGEPTIHPQILELASFARELGYEQIHVVSNGRKYSDKKFLSKLIKSGVTKFYVSIHSHKAALEDHLTSVKGSFKEKVKGLKNLKELKDKGVIRDRVYLNTVINKLNYRYLEQIALFYSKMGFTDIRFDFIRPEGRALANAVELVPRYSQIMKYVGRVLTLGRALKVDITFGAIPPCLFHRYNIKVLPSSLGEFNDRGTESCLGEDNTIKRFSVSEKRKSEYKVKRKSCKNCLFDRICEGVWKHYARLYGFKDLRPVRAF
jgi:MoaA/NifB/PqqE/SkfB family radical SAM enzyme